jgi:isoquinoline 1-oxidoreductase alpha subunit
MPTLTINGKPRDIQSSADTPLLWILRDELSLTGTKFGCGMGLCGACTVLADGEPIRSCSTTVDAVKSKKIVTIEGLSSNGTHPLQKAWSAENVPQCGYCQAGQIMSAAALLMKKPKPTDSDIDEAMDGNLCRCATYQRIRKAIHVAAGGAVILSRADGEGAVK